MRGEQNSDWQDNWMWGFLHGLIFSLLHALAMLMWAMSECTSSMTILEDLNLSYQLTLSEEESAQLWSEIFFNFDRNIFKFYLAILVLQCSINSWLRIYSKLIMHIYISWVISLICKMGIITHFSSYVCDVFSEVTGML